MAGEVATLGRCFIADGEIMPGLEVESDVTATFREMPSLQIDPEFRDLIPPFPGMRSQMLKESISTQGCRDRLLVWKDHRSYWTGIIAIRSVPNFELTSRQERLNFPAAPKPRSGS